MRKMSQAWIGLILCMSVIFASFGTARAEEKKEETITIETAAELVRLAENCRLDTYSEKLIVELEEDIDLTGVDFKGIPTFSGVFDGKGHTIKGLDLQPEGSDQGFIRYLRVGATIQNLKLEGNVAPTGSRSTVGSLVGKNAGTINNCSFSGSIAGADRVGGLVGCNQITGVIEACTVNGQIQGNHFIGGLAGENKGVIRQCQSLAQINTTVQENAVELTDITLDSVMESELAVTVTDIGGIAGTNMGVIRECENLGSVGYPQIGYNIGGIAGSQAGYIVDCVNRAEIMGRKEVGGIVGQMEPTMRMEFDEDTLQKLQTEMDTMMGLTGKTLSVTQSGLDSQIAELENQMKDAEQALKQMVDESELPNLSTGDLSDIEIPDISDWEELDIEDLENLDIPEPKLPDQDAIDAAKNNLSGSISMISGTMNDMLASTQSTLGTLNANVQALSNQMSVIGNTLQNAEEDLGGSLVDVSDEDTEEDTNGKVESCANYGAVTGDLNVGGIVGAMSFESNLDPELDVEIAGDLSLNFEGEVRMVTRDCRNYAQVNVNKQNGGGIVGRMALGLVKGCESRGDLQGEAASYLGGVAGRADSGYIRKNSVRCSIVGAEYVGGIAGIADVVSDCSSLVQFSDGAEKLGGVLGSVDEVTEEIEDNYYLPVGYDIGGIDGISYEGCAQALEQNEFFALKQTPDDFNQVSVRFVWEDGSEKVITLDYGEGLKTEKIPAVPEKDGHAGRWEGIEELDLTALYFDVSLRATYDAYEKVIASEALRADGRPILLVSSEFGKNAGVELSELTEGPVSVAENEKLLEAWSFALSGQGETSELRYLPAEELSAEALLEDEARIMVRDTAGAWHSVSYRVDGSYFVFDVQNGENGFCLVQNEGTSWLLYGLIGAGVLIIAETVIIVAMKIRRKSKAAQ